MKLQHVTGIELCVIRGVRADCASLRSRLNTNLFNLFTSFCILATILCSRILISKDARLDPIPTTACARPFGHQAVSCTGLPGLWCSKHSSIYQNARHNLL
jgi:hypothetical protein